MARILISSLGSGNKEAGEYKQAKYEIDGKVYKTPFIADALNQHIQYDKIFIVGTNKSIWDEAYTVFGGTDEKYHEELFEKKDKGSIKDVDLVKFNKILKNGSKSIIINYGLNDNELWFNFEKFLEIEKLIENGDEIFLDITHSFRSLSIMSFVMAQFSSTISNKNFKIKGLYYGMFEYSYENNGITPIVDIKLLLEIQEWIKAIDAIKKYSDFNPLVALLETAGIEKNVNNAFIQLNNTISMANMAAMKEFITNANKKITAIENSNNKIIALLSPEIKNIVEELDKKKMSDFQFALAKWFYKNRNYAMSYMALAEAVVTKVCETKYSKYDSEDESIRNEAKKSIDHPYNKMYSTTLNDDGIAKIRHNIAHQLNNRKDKVNQDIQRLNNFLEKFESFFN